MSARIRQLDWGLTPLGPLEHWAQPLPSLLVMMLASAQPMFLAWGDGKIFPLRGRIMARLGESR